MMESDYAVYRWEEPGTMHFERRLFIKHEHGEHVTSERVREQIAAEIHDFKPAKYRVFPVDRWVDVEVKAEVFLS